MRFEDLIEGVSVRDEFDEATGISPKVVIDWRSTAKGSELKAVDRIVNGRGQVDETYALPVGAISRSNDGDDRRRARTWRVSGGGAKTRDITGGLPRVAELFEARRPKDHAIISEIDGSRGVRQGLQEQAPLARRVRRRSLSRSST